jgi:hypothetical protein
MAPPEFPASLLKKMLLCIIDEEFDVVIAPPFMAVFDQ